MNVELPRPADEAQRDIPISARKSVAVVIPAYNEEDSIASVVSGALKEADKVIVVDDGSTDATSKRIESLPIFLVRHPRNSGKASALVSGFQLALKLGVKGAITLDADGQHAPADIPSLIDVAYASPDALIIGSRLHRPERIPPARLQANLIANFWISWAAGRPIADSQSGFRYYPSNLLKNMAIPHDPRHGFVFESEVLIVAARQGFSIMDVPVTTIYPPPTARRSYFRPILDIVRITRMVALKLLIWGMYPRGLWRCLRHRGAAPSSVSKMSTASHGTERACIQKRNSLYSPNRMDIP